MTKKNNNSINSNLPEKHHTYYILGGIITITALPVLYYFYLENQKLALTKLIDKRHESIKDFNSLTDLNKEQTNSLETILDEYKSYDDNNDKTKLEIISISKLIPKSVVTTTTIGIAATILSLSDQEILGTICDWTGLCYDYE